VDRDNDIQKIQACLANRLETHVPSSHKLAGVVGDAPSHYSKSPALWNAAFQALNLAAVYLPFDVAENRLRELIATFRECPSLLGVNVTVPYKLKVMEYLDELDVEAQRVQAVNTILRRPDGRLIGSNTDGEGFLKSLLERQPGSDHSFVETLRDMSVVLLGAGGSARAVAYHLAGHLGDGQLIVCNRTIDHARLLAREIASIGTKVQAISEEELSTWAPKADLIINSTTKGQGGMRRSDEGREICLEPYSALAPAEPAPLLVSNAGVGSSPDAGQQASLADIERNNEKSWSIASSIPKTTGFYDLIYFPEETVFLQHGRLTGHTTQNGKAMIICQAALAFYNLLCRNELKARNIDNPDTYRLILEAMYQAW
jgi:shikimate dehydrogenase